MPPYLRSMAAKGGRLVVSRRNFSSSPTSVGSNQPGEPLKLKSLINASMLLGYCAYPCWEIINLVTLRQRILSGEESQVVSKAA